MALLPVPGSTAGHRRHGVCRVPGAVFWGV